MIFKMIILRKIDLSAISKAPLCALQKRKYVQSMKYSAAYHLSILFHELRLIEFAILESKVGGCNVLPVKKLGCHIRCNLNDQRANLFFNSQN